MVNGFATDPTYRLRRGDLIEHHFHRHEHPIPLSQGAPIPIVYCDQDLLVADKPSGVPVHPSGRYHFNSLLCLLQEQLGQQDLFVLNRLDRLTSGLVLLARNIETVRRYSTVLNGGQVFKTYLARVRGEFPLSVEVSQPIGCANREKGIYAIMPEITKPPRGSSSKEAKSAEESGKPATTRFRRLHFDGHSSLVEALPLTGRTHQIRIHLQFLGFPIANDPSYGGCLYKGDAVQYSAISAQSLNFRDDCEECRSGSYLTDQNWYPSNIWLHSLQYEFPLIPENTPPDTALLTAHTAAAAPPASACSMPSTFPPPATSATSTTATSPSTQTVTATPTATSTAATATSPVGSTTSTPTAAATFTVRTSLPAWASPHFDSQAHFEGFLSATDPKFHY